MNSTEVIDDDKRMSFKAMAELLGVVPYKTAHLRYRKGYGISNSLLVPVGVPRGVSQRKHGMHESREYAAWERMHSRCRTHAHYLKIGITVCNRWSSFEAFYEDMGTMPIATTPRGISLDRENGALGYSKQNCRWATAKQQAQNISRNVNLTLRGETTCIAEWSRILGINDRTVANRVRRGLSVEAALATTKHSKTP